MNDEKKDLRNELVKDDDEKKGMKETLEEIDAEEVPDEEDLTFDFPCGVLYGGAVQHDFEIRELTGADQEDISAVARKNDGKKVANRLCEIGIERIGAYEKSKMSKEDWRKVIHAMTVPDQDYAMVKIRQASMGETIVVKSVCPDCGAHVDTEIDISTEWEVEPYEGSAEQKEIFELPKPYVDKDGKKHSEVIIRLANGFDREVVLPMARKNIAKASTMMLARICEFADGYPLTEITLRDMKLKSIEFLQAKNKEMMSFGYKQTVHVECPQCGNEYDTATSAFQDFL